MSNTSGGIFSVHCGLGKSFGAPRHAVDALCLKHDNLYQAMIDKGIDPYWAYNKADREFIAELTRLVPKTNEEAFVKAAAVAFATSKRFINPGDMVKFRGNKRPRTDDGDETDHDGGVEEFDTDMEGGGEVVHVRNPNTMAATAPRGDRMGTGGTHSGHEETAVIYKQPDYYLPNTQTVIVPVTFWYSIVAKTDWTPTQMKIRMNSPNDYVIDAFNADPAPAAAIAAGVFRKALPLQNEAVWGTPVASFPSEINASGASEKPFGHAFYSKLYTQHSVISCHWEVVYSCAVTQSTPGSGSHEALHTHMYESTGGTDNTTFPESGTLPKINECLYMKHMQWKKLKMKNLHADSDNGITIIEGNWKPGYAKRSILNDGDVKTWNPVGTVPTYSEYLKLLMFKHPLNAGYAGALPKFNVQVTLKYVVQYKDLLTSLQYPYSASAATTLSVPADFLATS